MLQKNLRIITAAVAITLVVGCTGGPKQNVGTIVGGIGGAVLGAQFGKGDGRVFATALGAIGGSMLGSHVGKSMDDKDRQLAAQTLQSSLENKPDNIASTWRNPNTQHSGKVVVVRTTEMPTQRKVCRDYVHTVVIDGQKEKVHGRACRDMRDVKGQWMVQKRS